MPTRGLDYGFQWTSNGEIQVMWASDQSRCRKLEIEWRSPPPVKCKSLNERVTMGHGNNLEAPLSRPIQAVSISGDGNTIAHGAFFDGNDSGSVRVDRWDGNAWTRIGSELPGSCPYPGCMELSREGSIIAIGNPLKNLYAGLVTVFVYDDDAQEWLPRGEPISGEIPGDMAGTSVSLSSDGTVLALGSPGRTVDDQISIGQAAIFKFIPAIGWSKVGQSLGGFEQLKQFGFSISLSGNGTRVAISAPFVDYHGDLRGMVYVYELSVLYGMWEPLGRLIKGLYLADNAGTSIALSSDGRTLAVGAPRRGYVQILVYDQEEGWIQIGFIESEEDQFGSSVTMSSDGRTVGACGTSLLGNGMVEMFRRADDLPRQSLHLCDDNRNAAMSADC
ncbi:hypothetical protein MHU86_21967 [Fragilaria crotonensis]|nr:hypothetical protein MHU86_21967 [Fragilaria crotonensis]